ncbi:MAG: ribosome-associated translation inhibitor RaiA [Cellulomonadaceae bacterium]|jgi:ribosomal subunit interface protein|nr:ribosome-associated translation inhibitor RaiA [Cellulomonadaceae bacterium]
MEIVIVGRHTEVSDRFRNHAEEKLAKVSALAPSAQRVDVEVTRENNPKLANQRERVELTVRDKGPVVRAEAAADDRLGALDLALDKLTERLRRARDRRKDHHRKVSHPLATEFATDLPAVPVAAGDGAAGFVENAAPAVDDVAEPVTPELVADGEAVETQLGDSPVIIRQKLHSAETMSVDEAVDQMELVGHDFFLFIDSATDRPSAVYKRRGWTYGVVQLDAKVAAA